MIAAMTDEKPLSEQVLHHVEGGVSWIVLNRPEAHNAITPDQRNHVIELLGAASADLAVRAVVLTANGKGFCTGADLRAGASAPKPERPEGAPERAAGEVARLIRGGAQTLVGSILDCEKPVIGAINGTAAGIGAHMAFACDLVIAAESAKFVEVFVRRGLVPDGGGAYLLPRLIGLHKARELLYFGDDLSAPDAERLGLVNLVVPADELEKTATAWATRLASGPTRSLALTKWLVNRSLDTDRTGSFADEALAQELAMGSRDANEGVDAFKERRKPEFLGW